MRADLPARHSVDRTLADSASSQPDQSTLARMIRKRVVVISCLAILALVVGLGIAISLDDSPLSWADRWVMECLVAHRSSSGTEVMATVTNLFGPVWVAVASAIVAVAFCFSDANAVRGVTVAVTVAVAGVLGAVLKVAVNRARPPCVDQASTYEASESFPSGHVTGTTALLVATALAATVGSARVWRGVAVAGALSVSMFAALTRVYLGVHWFSDVLAAVMLATAVAYIVPVLIPRFFTVIRSVVPHRFRPYIARESDRSIVPNHSQEGKQNASVTP